MKANLLAYWNGSTVQSVIELVYKIGKFEQKARTFLSKEVVERRLGICLDDGIVETTVDLPAGPWNDTSGIRGQSFVLCPFAYNDWTEQTAFCVCWTKDLQ